MASIALSAMQPLEIQTIDDKGVATLKTAYNKALASAQTMIDSNNPSSITAQVNTLQGQITQFNTLLTQINEIAAALLTLQPQEQISGTQTISTLDLSFTGSVTMV